MVDPTYVTTTFDGGPGWRDWVKPVFGWICAGCLSAVWGAVLFEVFRRKQ